MRRALNILFIAIIAVLTALAVALGGGVWYARSKLPQRSGTLMLRDLEAPVRVDWDERGVPHLQAQNEQDLYRALGFLHAQDRLFQMEMVRRLARGELAEILGPKLVETDRLFRTLELRVHAEKEARQANVQSPAWKGLLAYLDGVNEFQETRPLPLEFKLLGIEPHPYTPVDALAVGGYLAYTFAAALRTEPVLTYIRDQLGAEHLKIFDLEWQPLGVMDAQAQAPSHPTRAAIDWMALAQVGAVSNEALEWAGAPLLEGSNAWALSARMTTSGKPLLAGDPHIGVALPAVWYEAHLSTPNFELYGHHQALTPYALLGHNREFGWTLTMFQNDDMDLVALKVNPDDPRQVWRRDHWEPLQTRTEIINVKNEEPVQITLQHSPYGPVINPAFAHLGKAPIALWWTFLETDNPVYDALYELNRANTLPKARQAASKIHAPGLNVVWANAAGDIGWWAAAALVQRPAGVNPNFILDGATEQADKPGFYRFADNPQEENPARGYIVSANHQPAPRSGVPVPGYYNPPDRARRLDQLLRQDGSRWNLQNSPALQLDDLSTSAPRLLRPLLPILYALSTDSMERAFVEQLAEWDGAHNPASIAPTLYNQFVYELAKAAMSDELGEQQFNNLLRTRIIDAALIRLATDAKSPWWDDRRTPQKESRDDIVIAAWRATLKHLQNARGASAASWTWGRSHTLTHGHPLGRIKPLDLLFNVGPLEAPGGRETINHMGFAIGPAPWSVTLAPSTRRLIDFADASKALGINPVGQSGALFDRHYHDQADDYIAGRYQPMHLDAEDVKRSTRSTLMLQPAN